ncbi:DNA polymerase eta subunit [Cryptococcus neoformans C23]|uniref:DNA polymerase eta n=1 Tax=Cryptococcus neoformans (strain H99 / ATCC 208821 / CBS 10515 / FGSC 9487) TaxID=235443 RepID=J9VSP9_CRYN9|nr:DNA polymerase eta subunit [Cryptococcus neoformans var. grubii H99]AUB25481.1 DNA polymerase eta subunit [Cryptococcus neoformans var. grubii]OWZ31057.1 DNA polymerase eta subunit [Cryptococcus neoformans var. grubii AD2-60a]OWZ43158.1 DNA polymerase eta subunit [Cryptococcus neoformans var. grubii C23]OWZ54001.1 DNA polymerase eta subunit [Cryptococcus neoformans var. grubii 125.91]OXC84178.1 DNA polymerase eta subunit [Cryptococcus neoformans var. grubii AD1-7a]OXG32062.1 DNA polymerase|eukprot:XP_012049825.1 DNA polymerase eta subunit [Cryptococcus neoformans var. grubii H99]
MLISGGCSRKKEGRVVPTYRHLLSLQALTPANPLRTIAHCDIDAAYAQFEQVRLGLPDDIPLICAQWQSIIAVNYPARKYGIKRFTSIEDAKKMCPQLRIQHVATYRNGESEAGYWDDVNPRTHKVSLDVYRRESLKILAIFKEKIPRGEIEKASIDEAFLDLTPMVIERLLAAHPYLSKVPEDAPNGLDSPLPPPPPIDWSNAGSVFPIDGKEDGSGMGHEEGRQEDEGSEDGDESDGRTSRSNRDSWEDWALCMGGELMSNVREEVYLRLHYTCTAGIAHNKAMAKLCSAWKKPNNQTILRTAAVPAFLNDRDFTDIRSLGGKLGAAIAQEFGAKTVGDMLTVSLDEMQKKFGEESIWVYNILRGIDHSEVTERVTTKSMLASKSIRPAVTSPQQGHQWLSILAGELNVRLKQSREVTPGLWPKTLVLSYRQGIEPTRSRQTPFSFTRNLSTDYIMKYAKKLWDEATHPMLKGKMKLNVISLSFTGLEKLEDGQQGIEGFFSNTTPKAAAGSTIEPSSSTIPRVISKLNSNSKRIRLPSSDSSSSIPTPVEVLPSKKARLTNQPPSKSKKGLGAFLTKKPSNMTSSSSHSNICTPSSASISGLEITPIEPAQSSRISSHTKTDMDSWTCPKCGLTVTMPEELGLGEVQVGLLGSMKQEHEDWHFAKSLQDGGGSSSETSAASQERSNTGPSLGKRGKRNVEGIRAFFTPKPQ